MLRHNLTILPAVLLLAACNSPGNGTSQSEAETVPADDGTMAQPTDMSTPGSGSAAAGGTAEDGTAATGTLPNPGTLPGSSTDTPPADSMSDSDSSGSAPTDKQGTPPSK
jgi:hypothetical protein